MLTVDLESLVGTRGGVSVQYPFGFEGFEDREGVADVHPNHQELQSYCERSLRSPAEISRDEFMKIESHVSACDSCLIVLINERVRLLDQGSAP